ncbi:2-C-methyl-D-erythritol 4-phosphate cytidylyltransferase [Aestuariimicrobium ganziense]|uniref:2-C-methyl-D-erythritol 4-phosphate cytidylyltransferase n=1 Tax=Aestuariimicrobium ganziense TaxID=2773677 RepID=UPI001941B380|nr:2-C-methyl-D-erythritol 4-phosphate cytidylyltransferase [Aestuariimicrobium ganziense]
MSEPVVAIVVAAGSGVRLGASVPKAMVPLKGVPLLRRSAEALVAGGVTHLVVVVPDDQRRAFGVALLGCPVPWTMATGGARRQDSVAAGLAVAGEWAPPHRVVLVHDAARPLVPPEAVARVIAAVRGGAPAVVPVVAVADTIRAVDENGSRIVDRSGLRAVQTPQGFDPDVLVTAHRALACAGVVVTDDAAACERLGHPVSLVEGSTDALKITTSIDLVVAGAVLDDRERRATGSPQP